MHASVVATVLGLTLLGVAPHFHLIISGILVVVAYSLIVLMEFRFTLLVLTPLSYFFFWHWLVLGVAAIWKGLDFFSGVSGIPFSSAFVSAPDVAAGYSIYLLGVLLLHAGATAFRPVSRTFVERSPSAFPWFAFTALWVAGMSIRLLRPWFAWLGGIQGVLSFGSLASVCALALDSDERRLRPGRFWLVLAGGIGIEFIVGMLLNSKGETMRAFFPLAWIALRSRRPVWNTGMAFLAAAALYVGVVAPISGLVRQEGMISAGSRFVAAEDLISTTGVVRDSEASTGADEFFDRIFYPTPVGYLVSQVRIHGFRNGESMDYLLYAVIPRFLWPEKPNVTRGPWFDSYINQGALTGDRVNSLGQTNQGELYWNFGLPGVVLGMFAIGVLVAFALRIASNSPHRSPIRMVLYVDLMLTTAGSLETEFGSAFVGLVLRILVFGSIFWLTSARPIVMPSA
jgi:hypothetical protein